MLIHEKNFVFCEHAGAVYRQWSDETLCRRDEREVRRRRLDIEQRAERHLRENGELTRARVHAMNLARFEIARSEWSFDEAFASAIARRIYEVEPDFITDDTSAAPFRYRLALHSLGFPNAEPLARGLHIPRQR